MIKCPGTDSRYLKVSLVKCGNCGYKVEIFSDEVKPNAPNARITFIEKICLPALTGVNTRRNA